MPHQCTNCGRAFADGSKEMLSGCPDCGGNKFQFRPSGAVDPGPETGGADATPRDAGGTAPKKAPEAADARSSVGDASASERGPTAGDAEGDDGAGAVGRAAATVRDWVGTGTETDRRESPGRDTADAGSPNPEAATRSATGEDTAQASARSDVVSDDELPDAPAAGPETPPAGEVVDTPDDDSPGLEELREELNSQFESIRIVEPGQYELNLMELYEREEYIIALQEDGKYVIEVPDGWEEPDR
ncbi:OapC/ArvC family zinc-ribbon domain-containing protein [Halorussus marinus]|uniref:OapC/ArvC family zinc-ribbon domain-containing protein n=1 Tax=Halorussus marinus TaxID=2505976 RepID=UPI0010918F34|nr:Zn-ribbon containing protein [Halorussus marinus]